MASPLNTKSERVNCTPVIVDTAESRGRLYQRIELDDTTILQLVTFKEDNK